MPILIVTGELDTPTKHKALAIGASDFLNKPVDATGIGPSDQNHLETRRLHQQIRMHNEHLERRKSGCAPKSLNRRSWTCWNRLVLASEYRYGPDRGPRVACRAAGDVIGRDEGLLEDQVELIKKTAPLHDVGRIGVRDAIILKRAPTNRPNGKR